MNTSENQIRRKMYTKKIKKKLLLFFALIASAYSFAVSEEEAFVVAKKINDEFKVYLGQNFIDKRITEFTEVEVNIIHEQVKAIDHNIKSQKLLIDEVNLSYQFSSYITNQQDAAACKTFATLALAEAAYNRITANRLKFSEQWLLRLHIGENLILNWKKKISPAIYLGINTHDVLWWIRTAGICKLSTLSYNSNTFTRYDSSWRKTEINPNRMYKDFSFFQKQLFLNDKSVIKKCLAEAKDVKSTLIGVNAFFLLKDDSSGFKSLLRLGIPIYYVVRNQGGFDELNPPEPHAIAIIGFSEKNRKFFTRNSWGPGHNKPISFSRVDSNTTDNSYIYKSQVVLTKADQLRICDKNSDLTQDYRYQLCAQ
jgi:hypothetical protein